MRVPWDSLAFPLSTYKSVLCEWPETGHAWGTNCGVGQEWWVVRLCWTSGWLMSVQTTEAAGWPFIRELEQTFRPALYKTDTVNPHLAMPWLFSGLAWLNCLLHLSDVGAASLDWAGNWFWVSDWYRWANTWPWQDSDQFAWILCRTEMSELWTQRKEKPYSRYLNYKTDPSNPRSLLHGKSDIEKVLLEIRSTGTFLSQPHFWVLLPCFGQYLNKYWCGSCGHLL